MKSRPYIRWIMANIADALSSKRQGDHDPWSAYMTNLQDFSRMVCHSDGLTRRWVVPNLYVPRSTENPGWVGPEDSLGLSDPCHLALNLAKKLKDYKPQFACYKLLIAQSQDPTQLFRELACLQKSSQGDNQEHLETLLSSYLVCKDRQAMEVLLEELEQTHEWSDKPTLHDVVTYWARDFIERALKRNLAGSKGTVWLQHPPSFYWGKGLAQEAENFTWENSKTMKSLAQVGI